jgi:cytochrome c-type protein NapB
MRHLHRLAALWLAAAGLAAASLAACSAARPAPSAASATARGALKDRDLGLSKTSVFEAPAPPAWKEDGSAPGARPLPPRLSTEIPPVIPHGVADFLPIKVEQNACVDCHLVDGPKKAGEPTPIPLSHLLDLRRAPEKKAERPVGARWVCTACHVTQTDAPPLVGNGFRP